MGSLLTEVAHRRPSRCLIKSVTNKHYLVPLLRWPCIYPLTAVNQSINHNFKWTNAKALQSLYINMGRYYVPGN